ncbi:hypothetical protein BDV19DRAFT_201432 [Aspergillus venezuelensis]
MNQANAPGESPLPWLQRSRTTVLSTCQSLCTHSCIPFGLTNHIPSSYMQECTHRHAAEQYPTSTFFIVVNRRTQTSIKRRLPSDPVTNRWSFRTIWHFVESLGMCLSFYFPRCTSCQSKSHHRMGIDSVQENERDLSTSVMIGRHSANQVGGFAQERGADECCSPSS